MALSRKIRRFFDQVHFDGSGCWLWLGCFNGKGYGGFNGNGAHRFAYRLFKGAIEPKMVLDHLCRNRSCVNPRHLEQVTMRENYLRGHHHSALGLCKRGHPMTAENTYTFRSGAKGVMRTCLKCRMSSRRRWINRRHYAAPTCRLFPSGEAA